jgi:hypothetical protein
LFTSLYEKKEAIDFLTKKINKDISELYDRIDPNSPTITIQKIDDTKKCIEVFNKFPSMKNNNKKIFEYIKTLTEDEIKAFESYSKIYSSIIELDRNDNSTLNIFDQVDSIIKKAKFLFLHENEIFTYGEEENKITMDELIHLKNKINISPKVEKKEEKSEGDSIEPSKATQEKKKIEEEKKEQENKDLLQQKSKKLLFFKNLITNMEVIYENMQILRTKGNNLPIDIKIIIEYDKKK